MTGLADHPTNNPYLTFLESMMLSFGDFPPHIRLMLLSSQTQRSDFGVGQIALLAADPALDWPEFLAVTSHHRLSPLVYNTLDRLKPSGIPQDVLNTLHAASMANAYAALRSTSEVQRITALYAEAGLPLAVMKGVPLSQYLFGSPNARHVGDIDLLSEPAQLPLQLGLLAQAGYKLINPRARLTPSRLASYITFWKDFTFQNLDANFELDLHWRLFNNRFHAANPLLDHMTYTTTEVFGVPMRVFSPRDQFIYIAAHGVSDAWTYFKGLADVAAFLTRFTQPELEDALERAAELGLLGQISAAIHLSNDWMGTTALSPRLLPAADRMGARIRDRAEASLLAHHYKPHRDHTSPAGWLALELRLVPGVRSVVEVVRRFVWRPRVWQSVDLPDRFFWIYPLVGLFLRPRHHTLDD